MEPQDLTTNFGHELLLKLGVALSKHAYRAPAESENRGFAQGVLRTVSPPVLGVFVFESQRLKQKETRKGIKLNKTEESGKKTREQNEKQIKRHTTSDPFCET